MAAIHGSLEIIRRVDGHLSSSPIAGSDFLDDSEPCELFEGISVSGIDYGDLERFGRIRKPYGIAERRLRE